MLVSSASAKPSLPRASFITLKSCTSKLDTKEGATEATALPVFNSFSTSARSVCTLFAFCGHTFVQCPHRMQRLSMIFA